MYSDGDFSGWTAVTIPGFSDGQTSVRVGTGGNPDAFLAVTTQTNLTTYTAFLNPAFVYDPAQGAIDFIEASLDYRNIASFGAGHGVATLVLEQAGSYFQAGQFITGSVDFTWQSRVPVQFTQASFSTLAGSGVLDFGVTGAPIKLGFRAANENGNGIQVGYDNYLAVINNASAVPAPAAVWLLATGIAALAARRARRRPPQGELKFT